MKYFSLIIFLFIHACGCTGLFAQTYLEKQSTGAFNFLTNPGFENGTARWTIASECSTGTIPWNGVRNLTCGIISSAKTIAERTYTFSEYRPFIGATFKSSIYVAASSNAVQVCGLLNGAETSCVGVDEAVSLNAAGYKEYSVAIKIPDDQSTSFTAGVRIKTISTTSTSLRADQAYVGPYTGVVGLALNSAAWTPWSTVITSNTGSLTNYVVSYSEWTRQGQNAWYRVKLAFNGAAGTWNQPFFSLPTGQVPTANTRGNSVNNCELVDIGNNSYKAQSRIGSSSDVIQVTSLSGTNGAGLAVTQASPFSFGSGDTITCLVGPIQITGWEANTVADVVGLTPKETVYSATISGSDVVTNENEDWINGNCTNAGTGLATCTFITGFFSTEPNCTAIATTASRIVAINAKSSSSITLEVRTDSGTTQDSGILLMCQRASTDYTNARKTFQNVNFNIDSGTWTPVISSTVNISANTVNSGQWMRVGNIVTGSISIDVTPTASGGATTSFRFTLPTTQIQNFTNDHGLTGSGFAFNGNIPGQARSVSGTTLGSYIFGASSTSNRNHGFTFTYIAQ